jgi:hypothetical protein
MVTEMKTKPLLLAIACVLRPNYGLLLKVSTARSRSFLFSSSSSSFHSDIFPQERVCVSRLQTLQTLLSKHGAPGSQGCNTPDDLIPILTQNTPELLRTMGDEKEFGDLHPYLFPIAQSKSTGNLICAYRNPTTEESDKNHPWPIVESKLGGPGMQLLSLNSEHIMRRIVCENEKLADIYNEGLGQGMLKDSLDIPYEKGSVEKLGYGVDKYVLLRVGPFPDLYQEMARNHRQNNDEQSSLIAAEAANSKLSGFASTFRFYSRLLSSFPNREEESRDAARMCLRLPLPTIGINLHEFEEVAILAKVCDESDPSQALSKLKEMYELMKSVEDVDNPQNNKAPVQKAIEEADDIINMAVLTGKSWLEIRPELAEKFQSAGRDDMASFVSLQ